MQPAHPGRAHRHRAGDRRRPRRGAVPHRRRRVAGRRSASPTRRPSASRAASPCRRGSWPPAPARSPPTRSRPGPGVRVDACGYLGLRPAAAVRSAAGQGDRLVELAGTFASAVDRTAARAGRVPHRRPADQPAAAARHPRPPRGPRRRRPHDAARRAAELDRRRSAGEPATLALLDQQAGALAARRRAARRRVGAGPAARRSPDGHEARASARWPAPWSRSGRAPATPWPPATTLMVVSAMKMETAGHRALRRRGREPSRRSRPATASPPARSWPSSRRPRAPAQAAPARRTARTPGRRCWTRSQALQAHRPRAPRARLATIPAWCASAAAASSPAASASTCCSTTARFREVGSLAGFASYDDDGRDRRLHAGQPRRRLGHDRGPHRRSSAPTTSPRAAATPTARSAPKSALPRPAVDRAADARRSACSTARRAAAASPPWCPSSRQAGESTRQGKLRRHQGRPAARGRRRRLVPARPPRQHRCTPSSWPPCRWSTCCSAASSASARPRRCSATSR